MWTSIKAQAQTFIEDSGENAYIIIGPPCSLPNHSLISSTYKHFAWIYLKQKRVRQRLCSSCKVAQEANYVFLSSSNGMSQQDDGSTFPSLASVLRNAGTGARAIAGFFFFFPPCLSPALRWSRSATLNLMSWHSAASTTLQQSLGWAEIKHGSPALHEPLAFLVFHLHAKIYGSSLLLQWMLLAAMAANILWN